MSTKTAKEAVKETAIAKSDKMYLGPTIVGVVRHSTTFKDGVLPEKVKACVDELPMMEKLFVDLNDIPEAVKELKKSQSVLKTIHNQTAAKYK